MLKVEAAPDRLPTRLISEEYREALKAMQRGESVVVALRRSSAVYNAKKAGIPVLVEETDVPEGHVRVYKR